MCQIIVAPAGKKVNMKYLKKAQVHNEDGYGVSWYEDKQVKTYKTMDFGTFCGIVASLKKFTKVVHLRFATVGDKTIENAHPFEIPTGMMFHNGTIFDMKPKYTDKNNSDSRELAKLLSECDYDSIMSIEPLITKIIGSTINRVVTLEDDGAVTIINEDLGLWDEGIWYSNDYHLKPNSWCRAGCKPKHVAKKKPETTVMVPNKKKEIPSIPKGKVIPVFVYGTLKRGYGNNHLLTNALYLGSARTKDKWTMIGASRAFPYVVLKDANEGHQVKGECYMVDASIMFNLDRLEGVSSKHYKKVKVPLLFSNDDTEQEAIMYVACDLPRGYADEVKLEEWKGYKYAY